MNKIQLFRNIIFCSLSALLMLNCQPKKEEMTASITETDFGKTADGQKATLFTLRNTQGMEVKITNYGGIITHWLAPDKNGKFEDVVLGYDSLGGYLKETPYFGALVGRYGNRIANGKFTLDGKTYTLAVNNGKNHLHGGLKGFDKMIWATDTFKNNDVVGLKMHYESKDGEEGYPGNLKVTVTYTLKNDNSLQLDYEATTDKATPVNLTNHTYFNLTGGTKTDILGHQVMLNASHFLSVDDGLIPTGELTPVKDTPFDFTTLETIGKRIDDTTNVQIKLGGGYDHCWVFDNNADTLKHFATVYEPVSGRLMDAYTTQPATQFYTGNFLKGSITGKGGVVYSKRYGLCLETQHYPDSPNQPKFPTTILRPGETYRTTTVYKMSTK